MEVWETDDIKERISCAEICSRAAEGCAGTQVQGSFLRKSLLLGLIPYPTQAELLYKVCQNLDYH